MEKNNFEYISPKYKKAEAEMEEIIKKLGEKDGLDINQGDETNETNIKPSFFNDNKKEVSATIEKACKYEEGIGEIENKYECILFLKNAISGYEKILENFKEEKEVIHKRMEDNKNKEESSLLFTKIIKKQDEIIELEGVIELNRELIKKFERKEKDLIQSN